MCQQGHALANFYANCCNYCFHVTYCLFSPTAGSTVTQVEKTSPADMMVWLMEEEILYSPVRDIVEG